MIIEQLIQAKQFTETEKYISEFILNKNNQIDNLTSTKLGELTFSSQSAIVRFYKKLGLSSYREFISILVIERNEYFKTQDLLETHPSQYFTSYLDIQNTISRLYAKTISNTNLLLNKNTIIRVCNRLMNASSIDIYGIGISHTVALQMSFKLQSIGLNCNCHSGLNEKYIEHMNDYKTNISILFTLAGSNKIIIDIAKMLKEKGIYTVAVTGKEKEIIDQLASDCLFFDQSEYDDIDSMCSLFASEYITNLIYAILLSKIQIKERTEQFYL